MKGLLLLSGGIDSPVAGKLVQEQGVALEAVHFSLQPFVDARTEEKCVALARHLGLKELMIVPAGPAFAELTKKCDHKLYFVLSKRLMAQAASRLAAERGADVLVTGENLGQVSSQTLPNLATIDAAAALPVVRPLLGYDKSEIVDLARAYGTFETSKGPEVCDVLGPDRPLTRSRPHEAAAEEAKLGEGDLVGKMLAGMRVVATGSEA